MAEYAVQPEPSFSGTWDFPPDTVFWEVDFSHDPGPGGVNVETNTALVSTYVRDRDGGWVELTWGSTFTDGRWRVGWVTDAKMVLTDPVKCHEIAEIFKRARARAKAAEAQAEAASV